MARGPQAKEPLTKIDHRLLKASCLKARGFYLLKKLYEKFKNKRVFWLHLLKWLKKKYIVENGLNLVKTIFYILKLFKYEIQHKNKSKSNCG